MTIPIPAGLFTNNSYFWANSSFYLGSVVKPPNAKTLMTIDYSQIVPLPTGGITAYWFELDIGSQPPLVISNPNPVGKTLSFIASYGVPGVTYDLSITTTFEDATVRSDNLTISVPDENGCCGGSSLTFPLPGAPVAPTSLNSLAGFLTGEGTVFINTGVRFFVSAVAPESANILDQWYNTTTKVISELVTDGGTLFWMPLNNVPTAAVESFVSEKLTVTAPNTVTPLTGAPDGNVIGLSVNGQMFYPLGISPPFTLSGKNILWTGTQYSIDLGDEVIAIYTESVAPAGGFYMEQLPVAVVNTFPLLTKTPNGNLVELIVNGRTFVATGLTPPFSVTGKQITWLSTTFNVNPGNVVVVVYSY